MNGHLPLEVLEALAEGATPGAEAQAHLEACPECSRGLGEMRTYFTEMKSLRRWQAPPGFAARLRLRVDAEAAPGWKKLASAIFFPWRVKIPLQLAGAGLATVLLFWALPNWKEGSTPASASARSSQSEVEEDLTPEPPRPPLPEELALAEKKDMIAKAAKEEKGLAEEETRRVAGRASSAALASGERTPEKKPAASKAIPAKQESPAATPGLTNTSGSAESRSARAKEASASEAPRAGKAASPAKPRARDEDASKTEVLAKGDLGSNPSSGAQPPASGPAEPSAKSEEKLSASKGEAVAAAPETTRKNKTADLKHLENSKSAVYIMDRGGASESLPLDRTFDVSEDGAKKSEAALASRSASETEETKKEAGSKFSPNQESALKALGFKAETRNDVLHFVVKIPATAWDSLKTRLRGLGLEGRASVRALDAAPDSSEVEIR
jgi:hypothetical protein